MNNLVDTFSSRLDKAMKIKNIKSVELHERTGISESLISKYLSGNATARQKKLILLSDALAISPVWLMGYDVPLNSNATIDEHGRTVVVIPLLGTVKAGYNGIIQEEIVGEKEIPLELSNQGDFFALEIKGDSMMETLWDGDIVAVKKQDFAENGDIIVAIINGDEATVKGFKTMEDGIKLIPHNRNINPATNEPFYEDLTFTEKQMKATPVIIRGVVYRIIERKFKWKEDEYG